MQVAAVLCLPALAGAAAWACLRPPAPSLHFAAMLAAVYGLGVAACRAVFLERRYQVPQVLRNSLREGSSPLFQDSVRWTESCFLAPAGCSSAERPLPAAAAPCRTDCVLCSSSAFLRRVLSHIFPSSSSMCLLESVLCTSLSAWQALDVPKLSCICAASAKLHCNSQVSPPARAKYHQPWPH